MFSTIGLDKRSLFRQFSGCSRLLGLPSKRVSLSFLFPPSLSSPPQIRSIWKARVNIGIEPDRQGFEFLFKYDLLKKKKRKEVFLVEKKREKEGGGRFYFLKFKYSFRVDEEEGRKKSSEIILAIPSLLLFPFFRLHDRRQSYSLGEFREEGEGGGGHTRASQRPRSSHARSTLINHDGPARKEREKKKNSWRSSGGAFVSRSEMASFFVE